MTGRSLDDEAQSFDTSDVCVCAGVCGFVQESLPQIFDNICGFSMINAHFGKEKGTNMAIWLWLSF